MVTETDSLVGSSVANQSNMVSMFFVSFVMSIGFRVTTSELILRDLDYEESNIFDAVFGAKIASAT